MSSKMSVVSSLEMRSAGDASSAAAAPAHHQRLGDVEAPPSAGQGGESEVNTHDDWMLRKTLLLNMRTQKCVWIAIISLLFFVATAMTVSNRTRALPSRDSQLIDDVSKSTDPSPSLSPTASSPIPNDPTPPNRQEKASPTKPDYKKASAAARQTLADLFAYYEGNDLAAAYKDSDTSRLLSDLTARMEASVRESRPFVVASVGSGAMSSEVICELDAFSLVLAAHLGPPLSAAGSSFEFITTAVSPECSSSALSASVCLKGSSKTPVVDLLLYSFPADEDRHEWSTVSQQRRFASHLHEPAIPLVIDLKCSPIESEDGHPYTFCMDRLLSNLRGRRPPGSWGEQGDGLHNSTRKRAETPTSKTLYFDWRLGALGHQVLGDALGRVLLISLELALKTTSTQKSAAGLVPLDAERKRAACFEFRSEGGALPASKKSLMRAKGIWNLQWNTRVETNIFETDAAQPACGHPEACGYAEHVANNEYDVELSVRLSLPRTRDRPFDVYVCCCCDIEICAEEQLRHATMSVNERVQQSWRADERFPECAPVGRVHPDEPRVAVVTIVPPSEAKTVRFVRISKVFAIASE